MEVDNKIDRIRRKEGGRSALITPIYLNTFLEIRDDPSNLCHPCLPPGRRVQ